MIDRKEIELLIRANLKGGRDLASITKSIKDLEAAILSQADAARRGESAYEGLKSAATGLKVVQEELGSRSNTVQKFETLSKTIDRQTNAVERAKKALADYEAQVGSDRTDKQVLKVNRLTASLQAAENVLATSKSSYALLGEALREAGVSTDRLSEFQRELAEQQASAQLALNKVNQELIDYNENVRKARDSARLLAEQQRKLQALERGNAADARLALQQQTEKARALEQVESDRLATLQRLGQAQQRSQGQLTAESEIAALKESEQFLRNYTEAKRKANEVDAGLRKTADEAELAARKYASLARASTDLRPKVVSLRDAVESIINPSSKARQTLAGLEGQIGEIATKISGSQGPVQEYAEQFRNLQKAQQAIGAQAGLIDGFRNQIQALQDTRAELVAARAQVNQYAAAVRQGGDAGAQFTRPLAEAQVRLRAAAAAVRDQVLAVRESRDALRAAGIGTNDLANAQARLVAASQASTEAMRKLTAAGKENGEAVTKAGKGFSIFRDEGRTTLSFVQRLRGEILALTTAYFGVQGAINVAADSLKAFNEAQGLRSGLAFIFGDDPQRIGDEIAYIRQQAERLGLQFGETSKAYVKFAAAGVKSGAGIQEVRAIFESFAEVGRVLNLSPDQINGIFNAIGQSFSKGKIQAEELRQQIGERLPGAFAFAQEALKDVFPDLDKALEQGKVGAENILIIAESVRKAAQSGLTPALKSLDAEQQRFNNSVLEFKTEIANAGFADAYITLLRQLTDYFRSTDGREFAKTLGDVAKALVNGASALVTYRDELGLIVGLFASLLAGGLIAKVGASLGAIAIGANAATLATAALSAVSLSLTLGLGALVTTLVKLGGVLTATFFAGYFIGDYIRDQSRDVRIFGIALVAGFAEVMSKIKFTAMEVWEDLPRIAENSFKSTINLLNNVFVRPFLLIFKNIANALGQTGLAAGIEKAIGAIALNLNTNISSKVAQIRKDAEADLKRIRDIADGMLQDEVSSQRALAKAAVSTTAAPTKREGKTGPDEGEIKRRLALIDKIESALAALDAKTLKKQEDTLESLLGAAGLQYSDLAKDIAALGGKAGADFAKRFGEALTRLQGEITADFNDRLAKDQQGLFSKLEQLEASAGRKSKDELEARLDAVAKAQEEFYRNIEALRSRLTANARSTAEVDGIKARADAVVKELQAAEKLKFLREQLQAKETAINDLLKAREVTVKSIEEKVVSGELTRSQADAQIRESIANLQAGLVSATESAREFAMANASAFDPARLQEFLLKLEQAKNSSKALNAEFDRTGQIINSGINSGIDGAFNALYDSLVGLKQGTTDLGDAFDNAGKSILQTIANVLKELALLILKEQILIQIQAIRIALSGGAGGGGNVGFSGGGAVMHSGGVVGRVQNRSREVPTSWFANAPRYHSGGVVGLASNEYPTILQKNEEVLAASDPRNIMNGGGMQRGQQGPSSQRFVLVDDRARMAEAMAGAEGEEVTLVHLKRNIPTLRQWLR